ncbi:MAG: aspartyl/glutamyl-tRNA amidotransferase subunit C [Gemmatimonadetes bacterium]|nr:aspartyl/glutamyl-tRNA amidotransferase subunit C [Gemmatimonadota bacterium]
MSVSREDVLRIAALARIGVTKDRLDALAAELNGILHHVDVLSKLPGPSGDGERVGMSLAPDEPPPVALARTKEEFAPQMRDGFFLVPRLETHDDGSGAA